MTRSGSNTIKELRSISDLIIINTTITFCVMNHQTNALAVFYSILRLFAKSARKFVTLPPHINQKETGNFEKKLHRKIVQKMGSQMTPKHNLLLCHIALHLCT